MPRWAAQALCTVLAGLVALFGDAAFAGSGSDWTTYGFDPANTHSQPLEHDISTANVARLAQKWVATTTGDVSATPAVVDGAVYFGDFGGTLWKRDAATGALVWSHSVADYTGLAGDYARTSPSLDGDVLIVGTNKTPLLLGIDTTTGALLWKTQVNPDAHGTMTGSPILTGDTVITGVSAAGASGPGATFRADIAAVDALTGRILWQSYSVPDNGGVAGGYAGATMFSAPSVDVRDGLVFGTFGQLYTSPASVAACNAAAPGGFSESCEQPGAFWKSIVAFDLGTGAPAWSYRVFGPAPWQRVCGAQPAQVTWCAPQADTEKWDIGGSSPNVFELGGRQVVGFGGKSGVYYLFDAKSGSLLWNTLVGPGGDQGGFEWGTAYDGRRIYGSLTNQHHIPYALTEDGSLTSTVVTGGSWMALDPATGKILWQTADPQTETLPAPVGTVGVWDLGPVTAADGVVFASSMAKSGHQMFALDAATGQILWQFDAGSSVNAAPAVVDGSVYWGSGYARAAEGSGNNKLFAFSIDGRSDTAPPSTTISLSPSSPSGANGWYRGPVGVAVGAADAGSGVYDTRCVTDPPTAPAAFGDLPDADCAPVTLGSDGTHTVYAASEDRDNNVGSVVSRSFMIDGTPPTIRAEATSAPGANGWYSGNVAVHFSCADGGSGIAPGACPADQVLRGVGTNISSVAETVTDLAGNVSAPSNVVTVKIVNSSGLCAATVEDVTRSSKYEAAGPKGRKPADVATARACADLEAGTARKQVFVARYEDVVDDLVGGGWLSASQAATLRILASGL
jgi:polyvinyl alcohol dehydrogenase (cytochrome)